MTEFNPRRNYDTALDARIDRHHDLARAIEAAPPGGVCWLIVAPRRSGKTWMLRALEKLVTQSSFHDIMSDRQLPRGKFERGATLLIDEPGTALKADADAETFVNRCRALDKKGVRVVVALTPGEHDRVIHGCTRKQLSVERSRIFLPLLDDAEQRRVAHTDEAASWLPRIPEPWRRQPFLLEAILSRIEASPTLLDAPNDLVRDAITYVERDFRYSFYTGHEGLSPEQRKALRACLRGDDLRTPETDLLARVGILLREESGRCCVADPVLSSQMRVLRIHHISDVHVGPKSMASADVKAGGVVPADATGPRYVRDRYVEHLRQRRNARTGAHVLVCSGDCVEHASESEQYDEFSEWLQRAEAQLVEHPAVPAAQRTLLVGGNHDVDRNLAAAGDRARHAAFATMAGARPHPRLHEDPDGRAVAQVSFPEAGITVALLGSAEYGGTITQDPLRDALLRALKVADGHVPAGDTALRDRVTALRARLADDPLSELRSVLDALRKSGLDEKKLREVESEHWKVMRIDPGLVDDRDLARLRAHEWTHPVRIAVLHHPVSALPELELARFGGLVNAGAVKEALHEKGFQLVLHGHVHRGWFAAESAWRGDSLTHPLSVISAPTLGSRETAKDQGFNEIEIARDYDADGKACYAVAVRRYARNNATYEADGPAMALPLIYP